MVGVRSRISQLFNIHLRREKAWRRHFDNRQRHYQSISIEAIAGSFIAKMGSAEVGLKVVFYLYPCLLLLALLGVQTFQFWRNRRRDARPNASSDEHKENADAIRRSHTRPIWFLQLIICGLLIAGIVVAIRQAVSGEDDVGGKIGFSYSAYLVHIASHYSPCGSPGLE